MIWKNEDFKMFKCDFILLSPFNIIVDEQQFNKLIEVIEKRSELLNRTEEKQLCELLKIRRNKKRMTPKNIELKATPLSCEFCMKFTICESFSTEPLQEWNKVSLMVVTAHDRRTRQLLNLLNSQKKEQFLISTDLLTEEQKEKITKAFLMKKERVEALSKKSEEAILESLKAGYLKGGGENGGTKRTDVW